MYKFLAGILSIFFAYFKGGQAATNKIKADKEEIARQVQNEGWVEIDDGRDREQKAKDKKVKGE